MWLRVVVILAAIGAALFPIDSRVVESLYSSGIYPMFQPTVTTVSNIAPFALLDVLLVLGALLWVVMLIAELVAGRVRGWPRAFGRILARSGLWVSAFYLLFLALWGLNYRRVPLG